jgi:hypothetical protein
VPLICFTKKQFLILALLCCQGIPSCSISRALTLMHTDRLALCIIIYVPTSVSVLANYHIGGLLVANHF